MDIDARDIIELLEENYDMLKEDVMSIVSEVGAANSDDIAFIKDLLLRAVTIFATIREMSARAETVYRLEKNKAFVGAKNTQITKNAKIVFPSDKEAEARATVAVESLLHIRNNYNALDSIITEVINSLKKILGNGHTGTGGVL